jgi:hypothetical protein
MHRRRFYRSLTGFADLHRMRPWLASYLRFAGFSVVALAVAICTKIAPAEASSRPEPLIGDPPEAGQMSSTPAIPVTEADRIAALEAQVEALSGEIAQLRKALEVLGPLPDHPEMFIPVSKSEIMAEPKPDIAYLYAPAPILSQASSLFYQTELGSFASKATADAQWKQLTATNGLAGAGPSYAAVGAAETRLTAGAMAAEQATDALCVELSALAGACRVAAPIRAY